MKYMLSPEELKKIIQDEIKASKLVSKHYLEFKFYYTDEDDHKVYAGSAYATMTSTDRTPVTVDNYENRIDDISFNPQYITLNNEAEGSSFDDFACLVWIESDVLYMYVSGDNTYNTEGLDLTLEEIVDNIM